MYTRLVLFSPTREQPSPALLVDDAGEIVGRSALTVESAEAPFKGRTIVIVPGANVATRWLALEGGPPARIVETAAAALKDQMGAPLESLHLAIGEAEDDGARPVSVINRTLMQEFLDRAAELHLSPDVVVPDHLVLPPPDDGVVTASLNGVVAVRGQRLAFSAEEELASMLIGTRRRTLVEHASEIEQLLARSSIHIAMNLLQHDFAAGRGKARWNTYRRVAALAAIAALSPLALWTAEIGRNQVSARDLETRAEASARAAVGNTRSADPISELRGQLADLRANDAFMRTTAVLFEAISRTSGIELESLSYLQDGVIRATMIHGASSDVSAVRQALEQSGIAVNEDAAEERNGRILTTITLNRAS